MIVSEIDAAIARDPFDGAKDVPSME